MTQKRTRSISKGLVGDTSGLFTVVAQAAPDDHGKRQVVVETTDGERLTISYRRFKDGVQARPHKKSERRPEGFTPDNHRRWSVIKAAAARRGYSFSLTHADVIDRLKLPCHYCGAPPARGHSIDRYDNTIGYEKTNIRPCCYSCNAAKGTKTHAEFLKWARQLVQFQRKQFTD